MKKVIFVISVALIVFILFIHYRDHRVGPFNNHLKEYASFSSLPEAKDETVQPYRKGKVLPILMEDVLGDKAYTGNIPRVCFELYFDLPDELRPQKPEDVGTVILVYKRQDRVGVYNNGEPAWKENYSLKIVDRTSKTMIEEKAFVGSDPPVKKFSQSSNRGTSPVKEIIAYLQSLPQK